MSSVFETGKTIGLELEAPDIYDHSSLGGFQRAHDASIITPAKGKNKNIWEKVPKNLGGFEGYNLGTELVSIEPIKINENLEQYLKQKLSALFSYGQRDLTSLSDRAGIHIHITCPVNLRLFKEILNLGAHLEDVFFLLGGFGNTYRGQTNQSIYARPITKFGPPVIESNIGYAQVFNIEDLLSTKDIDQFICYYGNSDRFRDRYVPVRYTWLNLLPIIRQGSLEFRVFNITQNPLYLTSTVFLVKWFLEKAMERSYSGDFERLPENSVYDDRDKEDIIKTLIDICEGEILDKHLNILCGILEKTPIDSIRHNKNYVYSHLMVHPTRGNSTGTFWRNSDSLFRYSPTPIPDSKIKKPTFSDLHQAKNFTTQQKVDFFPNLKPDKIVKASKKKAELDFGGFSFPEMEVELPEYQEAQEYYTSESPELTTRRNPFIERREPNNNNNEENTNENVPPRITRRRLRPSGSNTYNYSTSWVTGTTTSNNNNDF